MSLSRVDSARRNDMEPVVPNYCEATRSVSRYLGNAVVSRESNGRAQLDSNACGKLCSNAWTVAQGHMGRESNLHEFETDAFRGVSINPWVQLPSPDLNSNSNLLIRPLMKFSWICQTWRLALQKWTAFWQNTPESDLEPLGPNGPLPFTSTVLPSLAYVINCCDLFRPRTISAWAPVEIAESLRTFPPVDRNRSSLLAAYHATNFLSTLVKLGVQYFKCNQSILWGIEATLCDLDCSVFLENWLRGAQDTIQRVPLTGL